jgi:hypothetical protein
MKIQWRIGENALSKFQQVCLFPATVLSWLDAQCAKAEAESMSISHWLHAHFTNTPLKFLKPTNSVNIRLLKHGWSVCRLLVVMLVGLCVGQEFLTGHPIGIFPRQTLDIPWTVKSLFFKSINQPIKYPGDCLGVGQLCSLLEVLAL